MQFSIRHLLTAAVVSIPLLVGAAWGSTQFVGAQSVTPVVFSGADIGFRMSARKGDTPVGQLVVRVNGEWKEVEFSYGLKPVTK
jgi:hypothetical protein